MLKQQQLTRIKRNKLVPMEIGSSPLQGLEGAEYGAEEEHEEEGEARREFGIGYGNRFSFGFWFCSG
ncbi:unnamed protein product [Trifolium pratense]|uniref:Uncharacterized protein n=1 Tax=Trifolium pratense TaxID=57577 RepID=A0ACB0M9F9_TRIPR|nr:unnamed protein product [Trifolium pratense]